MFRFLFAALVLGLTCNLQAAELDIELNGIRNNQGNIILSLFDNAAAFEQQSVGKSQAIVVQKAQRGAMTFRIANLRAGRYALMVHHDANSDNEMEMDGKNPVEGYAFSKGVGRLAVPTFSSARIDIKQGSNIEVLSVIYLKN